MTRCLIAFLVLLANTVTLRADPGFRYPNGSCSGGPPVFCVVTTIIERTAEPGTFDVLIQTDRVDSVLVHLYTTSSSEKFGNITVLSQTTTGLPLIVLYINGHSTNHLSSVPATSISGTIAKGTASSNQRAVLALGEVRLSGNLNSADVNSINLLSVAGDVTGLIRSSYNSLVQGGGSATQILVGGDIRSNVQIDRTLGRITAGGALGTETSAGVFTDLSVGLDVVDGIVANSIASDIAVSGDVGHLSSASNVRGSIVCRDLTTSAAFGPDGLQVTGDLDSTVTVRRSLTSASQIRAGAIKKQIIINAANQSGTWSGEVRFGSGSGTALSGPAYAETPGTIGGGYVGLAPYQMYGSNSIPVLAGTYGGAINNVAFNNGTTNAVVRFYGPLVASSSGAPFATVERFNQFTSTWVDVTSDTAQSLSGNGLTIARATSAAMFPQGRYRVTPISGRLLCAGVDSTPAVSSYTFLFRLGCTWSGNPNPADIVTAAGGLDSGPDGLVTGDDFDAFISAFFSEYQLPGGAYLADVTDGTGTGGPDGFLTGSDFDKFMEAFFAGCDS